MNPHSTVHELSRMLKEIQAFRETRHEYYITMMKHLNDMCVLTLLEFSGTRIPKANLEDMNDLIHLCRLTK
jgi:hypothetical protein